MPKMPQKVCPYCATLSETASDACPNCGRRYARRRKAPAIVAGAVAAGVVAGGAIALAVSGDDDPDGTATATATATARPEAAIEPHSITAGQARAMALGSTVNGIRSRFGEPKPDPHPSEKPHAVPNTDCVYYNLRDEPGTDVRVCYEKGRLAAVTTIFPPEEQ